MALKFAILNVQQHRQLIGQDLGDGTLFNPVIHRTGRIVIGEWEISQVTNPTFNWLKSLPLVDVDSISMPDTTPPNLYPYAVEIPAIYQWAFPGDKFILSGFEIPLDSYQSTKIVNLAYFDWLEFRAELDSGNYEALKRSLMPLWDYVALQVTNNNIIVL